MGQGSCRPHPRSGNAGPVSLVPQELAGTRAASRQVWGMVGCTGLQPRGMVCPMSLSLVHVSHWGPGLGVMMWCVVSSQLLTSMSQCLSLDPLTFSVWRQLYTKHLSQSRSVCACCLPAALSRASTNLLAFRSVLSCFLELLTEPCVLFPPIVCF